MLAYVPESNIVWWVWRQRQPTVYLWCSWKTSMLSVRL